MGESGWNPNQGKDRYSASPSRTDNPTAENSTPLILIVEDNVADVFLIHDAIEASGIKARTHVARDGQKAIRFFDDADRDDHAPCPHLVILDVNLPLRSGREVLQHLRKARRSGHTRVIVATTSNCAGERDELMRLGANRHFIKPTEYDEFLKLGALIKELFDDET
jgi:chemotaxis family two-component system response regulator Rcp1